MKFGIIPPYGSGPVESPEFAIQFAQLAEAYGFESLWVVEHVIMAVKYASRYPYDPSGRSPFPADLPQPDPLLWLSYIAAATSQIRLATGVLNLPQRNPLILAKELATLDRLSSGRVELGIGVGWVKEEAEAVGADWPTRGRRANESIEVMRTLWREPVASFRGEFVRFDEVVCEPRPVQAGGVPIVVGGHSVAAARRAGRYGNGFFPLGLAPDRLNELLKVMNLTAQENGRSADAIELTVGGRPDLRSAEAAEQSGASRMVVAAVGSDVATIEAKFATFRKDVMERC